MQEIPVKWQPDNHGSCIGGWVTHFENDIISLKTPNGTPITIDSDWRSYPLDEANHNLRQGRDWNQLVGRYVIIVYVEDKKKVDGNNWKQFKVIDDISISNL